MSNARSGNAVRAGVFVIGTIVIAVAVVVTLAGLTSKLHPTTRYTVRFSLTDGAAGLEMDSAVRLGGRDIGRVVGVRFESADNGDVTGVLVQIAIDDDLVVHEGTTAFLERPLLGSGATLNFESLGELSAPAVNEGGVIPGVPQVPQFMAQAGYGSTQREQLQSILTRTEDYTIRFDGIIRDIEAISADARGRSTGWFDRADEILSEVQGAAAEMRTSIEEGRALVASVQDGVDTNRDSIDAMIANIESASKNADEITARFNEHTIALVEDLLEEGRAGVADARSSISRIDTLLAEQTPAVRKSIANARLASDQLRLTMGEVRRSPWRLLHRPAERELEFELLYDAARAYADAVSDLRDAGEALDSVATTGASAEVVGYTETITEAFERYRSAESRFLDLLTSNAP